MEMTIHDMAGVEHTFRGDRPAAARALRLSLLVARMLKAHPELLEEYQATDLQIRDDKRRVITKTQVMNPDAAREFKLAGLNVDAIKAGTEKGVLEYEPKPEEIINEIIDTVLETAVDYVGPILALATETNEECRERSRGVGIETHIEERAEWLLYEFELRDVMDIAMNFFDLVMTGAGFEIPEEGGPGNSQAPAEATGATTTETDLEPPSVSPASS